MGVFQSYEVEKVGKMGKAGEVKDCRRGTLQNETIDLVTI